MSTATLEKPKTETAQPKCKQLHLNAQPESNSDRQGCSSSTICTTCRRKRIEAKKKKPMRKLGSWRGAFKGTLDF